MAMVGITGKKRTRSQSWNAWVLCLFAFILLFASLTQAQDSPLLQKPAVAGAIQVIDSWILANRSERGDPGLSIAIVHDQELLWAKGYGFADLEKRIPAAPGTRYRLASLTKLFTATAILQLRDTGKLQLDDPVEKHLPWFHVKQPDGSSIITIRELLTHTSGLTRDLPIPTWNELRFPSREEMIRLIPTDPAVFAPDSEYKYSNLAMAVAGEIVAAVSGQSYEQYVQQHILDPLGMRATLIVPSANTSGLAVGYRKRVPGEPRQPEIFINFNAYTPAAGITSNVEDLAKFVSLQFREGPEGGAQVLSGPSLHEMQRVHFLRPDWQNAMGLSWEIRHSGQNVYVEKGGTCPGYRSEIALLPREKLGVIVLLNGYDSDPVFYTNQALAILATALAKSEEKPKPPAAADPSWAKLVGTYTWKHADAEVMIIDGELVMITPDSQNPWDSRVQLVPAGPNKFKQKGGPNDGESLIFDVDANGNATRLWSGTYYRIRVSPPSP